MQKLLPAVLWVLLSFTLMSGHANAVVSSSASDPLLVKKKRLMALQKAATADERRAADAALQRARDLRTQQTTTRRPCGTFMQCLFGNSRKRIGSAPALAGTGLSGRSMRDTVAWNETKYKPGTLVVKTPERALYYVLGEGEAVRYSIGVGREGFQWSGNSRIVAKQEWPTWHPPAEMIKREAAKGHMLPDMMEGGPENPLGARAMYIGGTIFRVHGTNNESSIGGAVSSGCIRMMNADVIDLYKRVKIGSPIFVYQ